MKGYGPPDALVSPRFAGIATFLRLPLRRPGRRRRGGRRAAVRHRRHLSRRGALRAARHPRGLAGPASGLQPRAAGAASSSSSRWSTTATRRWCPASREPLARRDARRRWPRCTRRASCRSAWAATTPCCCRSCAPRRAARPARRHARSTRTPTLADEYFGERYTHGTRVRRAVEEGLVDPARSTLMGMRGGLYGPATTTRPARWASPSFPGRSSPSSAPAWSPRPSNRPAGKAFLSFDIDFVDPAFAPGTGTPEVRRPDARRRRWRCCAPAAACDIVGADVVEVVPDLDHSATHQRRWRPRRLRDPLADRLRARRAEGDDARKPAGAEAAHVTRSPACSSTRRGRQGRQRARRRPTLTSRGRRAAARRAARRAARDLDLQGLAEPSAGGRRAMPTGPATGCSPSSPPSSASTCWPARSTNAHHGPGAFFNTSVLFGPDGEPLADLPQDPPLRRGRRRHRLPRVGRPRRRATSSSPRRSTA